MPRLLFEVWIQPVSLYIVSDPENEGMKAAATLIEENLSKLLHGCSMSSPKALDDLMLQVRGETPELNITPNITCAISLAAIKSLAISKSMSLYKCR